MHEIQVNKSSFRESIKALEADIQHANSLAASLPRDYSGDYIQMRLSYSPFAPFFLYLIEWMDYSCTDSLPCSLGLLHILVYKVYVDGLPSISSKERKATLREFYATVYPSLRQLEGEFTGLEDCTRSQYKEALNKRRGQNQRSLSDKDIDRDDECGICMENCTKMVLPNCGHSMCISCFHDWYLQFPVLILSNLMSILGNARSQSCPFCRGSLSRVSSKDLWLLTGVNDVVDAATLAMENLTRFYLYIENLPLIIPDTHVVIYDYML